MICDMHTKFAKIIDNLVSYDATIINNNSLK